MPFATAVGVSRTWNVPLALLLVSVLCFYIARTSWLQRNYGWTALLLAGGLAALRQPVGLTFIPAIVRAVVGVVISLPILRIKRLGWTEVGYAVLFAAALIGLWR